MAGEFTITNVKNMSNENADEINQAAKDIEGMIDILEGQKNKPYREKNVAHRGFDVDREVTIAFLNAVRGVSTIKDKEYASFVNPISTIDYNKALQNVRKGNYGYMEETKAAQRSINAYMRKYGLSIEVKPTLSEKRNALQFIKATDWKRGNNYKKERMRPDDYEISIDKNGKGSITLYQNNEKMKTIEFKIDKEGKIVFDMVKLYQILEDGWLGVETLRALSVSLNHLAESNRVKETVAMAVEIEGPPTKVTVAVSLSELYGNLNVKKDNRGLIYSYNDIRKGQDEIYKRMSSIPYEQEKKLRSGEIDNELLFNNQEIENTLDNSGVREKKNFIKKVDKAKDSFLEKIKGEEETKGVFALKTIKGKGRGIDVDFSEVDSDFNTMISNVKKYFPEGIIREKHIEFIEEKRKEVKEGFMELAKKANNVEQFIQMSNESEVYGTYQTLLTNYTKYPLQYNIFNLKHKSNSNYEDFKMSKEELEKRLNKYVTGDSRNIIDIQKIKGNESELYANITLGIIERENNKRNKRYNEITSLQPETITLSSKTLPVRTENGKTKEDKKVQPAIVKMMPKKSPSQEELDALETNIKKDPLIANLYVEWFNKNAEKQGVKRRLSENNPTELFDKMGVDFWKELKQPGPIMNKLLRDYELSLNEVTNRKEFSEFENYVKMRTYEGKRTFHLQMDNLGGDKLRIAVQLYGVDFILRDRNKINSEIKETAKMIEKDKIECGAFQIFANEYYGKKVLVEDNRIGDKTKSYMYDKKGNPSALLMIYNQTREQNQKESTRLLDMASKNEERKRSANINEKSFKRAN